MKPLLGYFGHHKCASTWISSILHSACHDLGLDVRTVYNAHEIDGDFDGLLRTEDPDLLIYSNAHYSHVETMDCRGVHVVRDPRDIVVSAYFSHRNSHATHAWPELVAYREKLRAVSKDEGLFLEMDFRRDQFEEMMSWPDRSPEGILRLKTETLTQRPYEGFLQVFDFLGLADMEDFTAGRRSRFFFAKAAAAVQTRLGVRAIRPATRLPAERILGIVWEHSFDKLSGGRTKGEEDPNSHYRKGVAGDWVNHFNRDHLEYFAERYTDVLIKYGYEESANWVDRFAELVPH